MTEIIVASSKFQDGILLLPLTWYWFIYCFSERNIPYVNRL